MEIIKRTTQGNEGKIKSYAFRMLGKAWIVALSETKWHAGEKYKKTPIWVSSIGRDVPAIFIWKLAIGYKKN